MIEYIGITKHFDDNVPPSASYYNIPIEYCYEVFDAMSGYIISLIDINDVSNSVCVQNDLFPTTGIGGDEIIPYNTIVIRLVNHIKEVIPGRISILKVSEDDMVLFDTCTNIKDVVPTIERNLRNNRIDLILYE